MLLGKDRGRLAQDGL